MDLLAIVVLGGVFSGIITGNLVHAGQYVGTAYWRGAGTALAAVAAFAVGVWVWARLLGPPERAEHPRSRLLLAAQTAVLGAFALVWAYMDGVPPGAWATLAMLVVAALTMGAQSAWARASGASTTYLTGALASAMTDWATGAGLRAHRAALIRLGALMVGAMATMLVLVSWPWAAALVPLGCVTAGLVLWWRS